MERPPSPTANKNTVKFTCSYGGKILPRNHDGKLRYHGGHTRVLSVHRSVSFSELMKKMNNLNNTSSNLKCQLPTEDLDALVSIKSDEDLKNLIEEYDRTTTSSPLKIRAFLFPIRPPKTTQTTPPASEYTATSSPSPKSLSPSSSFNGRTSPRFAPLMYYRNYGGVGKVAAMGQPTGNYGCHHCCCRNPSNGYLVHSGGSKWQ